MSCQKNSLAIYLIAINNIGPGLSGGDTIWLNFLRHWNDRTINNVQVIGSFSTYKTLRNEQASGTFHPWVPRFEVKNPFSKWGIFKNTVVKIWHGCRTAWKARKRFRDGDIIYSASDFLPDVLPALILKLSNRKIKWVAGFYLFAPVGYILSLRSVYRGDVVRGIGFWLSQKISYPLIKKFADVVYVTSVPDAKKFRKTVVVRGGVNIPTVSVSMPKEYDVIFIGRFHHQKGVRELMRIWKLVRKQAPHATLCCIGDGALLDECKASAPPGVSFVGPQYGSALVSFIKSSRVVVHPATYDSGGMAMAEAMAYGLPGVSFDLESLKEYYADGVWKVPCFDEQKFADIIICLLDNKQLYEETAIRAFAFIRKEWDWKKRCETIWQDTMSLL